MQTKLDTHNLLSRLVSAAVCLALCMVLPFLTGQIPQVGSMLCPMHIPVLLAGFLCGPWWALAVGAVAPALRYLLFGMPPLLPVGLGMTFELLAYGLVAGLLYRKLPKKNAFIYVSLIGAMIAGRIVWGVASMVIYGAMGNVFTWPIFVAGAVGNALPGIVLHIIVVPVLVMALKKAKILAR
jgi:riboflavin transporter FmnP